MSTRSTSRGPTVRDLSRLVFARAGARLALVRAGDAFADAMLAAYRAEIGATVRSVSPFLVALLGQTGFSLDQVAFDLRPDPAWPDRPGLPTSREAMSEMAFASRWRAAIGNASAADVVHPHGHLLHVHVMDHSLEVAGRIGNIRFVTLFGTLCMEITAAQGPPPLVVSPGRLLEDEIDLPANLRRGWIIERVSRSDDSLGTNLSVRTGVRRYRLPWMR